MERVTVAFVVALGVTLTVYFGIAAWRVSNYAEVTGSLAQHRGAETPRPFLSNGPSPSSR